MGAIVVVWGKDWDNKNKRQIPVRPQRGRVGRREVEMGNSRILTRMTKWNDMWELRWHHWR